MRSWVDSWLATVEVEADSIRVELNGLDGVLLKACLPRDPSHPRALIYLLEGLALWVGRQLCVVICADSPVNPALGLGEDGDAWPRHTPFLDFLFVDRTARAKRKGSR
jgi:hypothetical protein